MIDSTDTHNDEQVYDDVQILKLCFQTIVIQNMLFGPMYRLTCMFIMLNPAFERDQRVCAFIVFINNFETSKTKVYKRLPE